MRVYKEDKSTEGLENLSTMGAFTHNGINNFFLLPICM
jgi:hypothetical protein